MPVIRFKPRPAYLALAAYILLIATGAGVMIYAAFFSAGSISDSFSRRMQQGWGSIGDQVSYTVDGAAADFRVDGRDGVIRLSRPNVTDSAYLDGISLRDLRLDLRVRSDKLPTGGSEFVYLVARQVAPGTQYLGRVRLAPDGSIRLLGLRELRGTTSELGNEVIVPFMKYQPNSILNVEGEVVGVKPTAIRLRAWADWQPHPANWLYASSDSTPELQAAGTVGVRTYLSGRAGNAPVQFLFDSLELTSYDFALSR